MRTKPDAPPRNWRKHSSLSTFYVETINGRQIDMHQMPDGRAVYAVGRVGFYHLDEARIYAARQVK